eukprot:COSAG02_NODE_1166_length_14154_cov_19.442191_2_plen_435_part_00
MARRRDCDTMEAAPRTEPIDRHALRLDLKQATAAVFYALARGWLAVAGLAPAEEQNEHIQSEETSGNFVLVRETERSRAIISTSITEHVRRAGTTVRDSYPAGGVAWQKILDHLTKSGRGKFESTHKGKVTTGSWRRYGLKECTQPKELLQWVRCIVPSVQGDALLQKAPPVALLPDNVLAYERTASAYSTGDAKASQLLQQARLALDDEARAHARTKRQLDAAVSRNIDLEMRVRDLQSMLVAGSAPFAKIETKEEEDFTFLSEGNGDVEVETSVGDIPKVMGTRAIGENNSMTLVGPDSCGAVPVQLHVPAPVVVDSASGSAARGVKRQGAPLAGSGVMQPRDGPYGTRRLWRVVTPSDGSREQVAAVEFVEGSHGYLAEAHPLHLDADDAANGELADANMGLANHQEDGSSPVPTADGGWAPTDVGPIQFS